MNWHFGVPEALTHLVFPRNRLYFLCRRLLRQLPPCYLPGGGFGHGRSNWQDRQSKSLSQNLKLDNPGIHPYAAALLSIIFSGMDLAPNLTIFGGFTQ